MLVTDAAASSEEGTAWRRRACMGKGVGEHDGVGVGVGDGDGNLVDGRDGSGDSCKNHVTAKGCNNDSTRRDAIFH
jgi:hypothetical protein